VGLSGLENGSIVGSREQRYWSIVFRKCGVLIDQLSNYSVPFQELFRSAELVHVITIYDTALPGALFSYQTLHSTL
jgi:hypothetical protein